MDIPLNDLSLHHAKIKSELNEAIENVIEKCQFIRGPEVDQFEKSFSKLIGTNFCVSCGNGTDAIYIALRTLGVKPGDEVIVPACSWIATSETVTQSGAKVVFCDVGDDFLIDPLKIEEKITSRTVGIIPVHLYGQMADMAKINEIKERHGLWIIEDCAQAHLATYSKKTAGTFGEFATFSFYPGKNLGAMGDAGALVCDDPELALAAAKFARHGGIVKGTHEIEGINSRLDGIQAAILNVKVKYIKRWTEERQEIASRYIEGLSELSHITLPHVHQGRTPVWHLFVIRSDERDRLAKHLKNNGISTTINYPVSLPFLPAYDYMDHTEADFPKAFEIQSKILSLPIFPEMTVEQVDFVIQTINDFR
ncbi:MAG: DegT/DnrJ/EryC1/StrS family aminotransferase [Rhodothermales bacterium]